MTRQNIKFLAENTPYFGIRIKQDLVVEQGAV